MPAVRDKASRGQGREAARLAKALICARWTVRPLVLSHLVTCRCCCQCATCLWRDRITADELTAGEIARVYHDAATVGVVLLSIWGGEPLLREDLPEILASAAHARLQTTLITNCAFLPDRIHELAPHLNGVICSLDWPGTQHDTLRGYPGLYERVVDSIRLMRRRYRHIRVMLNSVVSRLNAEQIPELVRLAANLNVSIFVHPIETGLMGPAGFEPAKHSLAVPSGRLGTLFRQLLRMKQEGWPVGNSATYLRFIAAGYRRYRCHARKVYIELWPNGDLMDCLNRSRPLANLRHVGLAQLLRRSDVTRLRTARVRCCVCANANVIDCSSIWSLRLDSVFSLLKLYRAP